MKKQSMLAAIILLGMTSMAQAKGSKVEVSANVPQCQTPEYPLIAFLNEEQGNVVINVLVDKNGKILDTKTEKTSGYWNLDHASRRALNKCSFEPAKNQTSWQKVGFNWKIEA